MRKVDKIISLKLLFVNEDCYKSQETNKLSIWFVVLPHHRYYYHLFLYGSILASAARADKYN